MRSISTRRLYPRLLSGSKIGFVRLGGPECSIAAVWNNSNLQFVPSLPGGPSRGTPYATPCQSPDVRPHIIPGGCLFQGLFQELFQGDTIRNAVPIPMS